MAQASRQTQHDQVRIRIGGSSELWVGPEAVESIRREAVQQGNQVLTEINSLWGDLDQHNLTQPQQINESAFETLELLREKFQAFRSVIDTLDYMVPSPRHGGGFQQEPGGYQRVGQEPPGGYQRGRRI